MNMRSVAMMVATAGLFAGCMCDKSACKAPCKCDPVIGNWSVKLAEPMMPASSIIVSRDAAGKAHVLALYRWGSPEVCSQVVVEGSRFAFVHPYGQRYEGSVMGGRMVGRIAPWNAKAGKVTGAWKPFKGERNPAIPEGVKTSDAKLGKPINLLKNGLDDWKLMDKKAKNGWSFKDGVLSNKLGTKPDGSWAGGGANLMTKRGDFYDFNLEYDVRVPKKSNSGVYLRGRFEIRVVDSFNQPVNRHNMAAYYGRVAPRVAAEKAPGEWQHVSVTLYRQHLTVVLNGVTIIENAPVVGVTGGALDADLFATGPIYLQGDHSDADFKNMILRPAM